MKIWLIQIGEPLPSDPGNPRLLRIGMLADALLARGHSVTWWASTFHRISKTHRFSSDTIQRLDRGLKLILLHAPGYERNISWQRMRYHELLAARFRCLSATEDPPDIIHCGFPTIELSDAATTYGTQHGVPVVLDARDLWPDIFLDALPRILRPAGRLLFCRQFRQARRAFRRATAISGHTPTFVEFGLRYAGRPAGSLDKSFPFGYPVDAPPTEAIARARAFWQGMGVEPTPGVPLLCFFGSFGEQRALDLSTPIEAAKLLDREGVRAKFVMCGAGPSLESCRRLAADATNIIFPGWIETPEIWTLMRIADAGLLPYLPARDFAMSLPNKAVEYLSASLPIVTSLTTGYGHDVLQGGDCAYFYTGRAPRELAAVVRGIARDPGGHKEKCLRAGILFAERFSADVVYSSLSEYLESIVGVSKMKEVNI